MPRGLSAEALQIATVGLSTAPSPGERSAIPLSSSVSRSWISGSNLVKGRSPFVLELSPASTSWSTVSISATRFMLIRISNSSSTDATKSITLRLSHSRSWAKRVAAVTSIPLVLMGSISLMILA